MTKTIQKKKKQKKAKWLSKEALHIMEERREAKRKGERERYTQLKAEFQRIARRRKKAFLRKQCKEIEGNRLGKTRDLFKNLKDTEGTFHGKRGTIKDRNGKNLTEQKMLRRGGKNTQNNYTEKVMMTLIMMMMWSLN